MIDIMDRIWLDNNLDLAMTPYKVMGTDCMQGFMEFNMNAETLAFIQHKDCKSLLHTFSDTSVHDWFVTHVIKDLSNDSLHKDFAKFRGNQRIEPIEEMAANDDEVA